MQTLIEVLNFIGYVSTVLVILAFIYGVYLWIRGVSPALLRLGNGLAKRKIAIFAKGDNLSSMKKLLEDSGLFNKKNICEITKKEDVGICEQATLYLVFWNDSVDYIDEILQRKPDGCALIVYAPVNLGRLTPEQMEKLDGHRHTAISNFRGRLLNDIVTAMITTSYEKK